MPTSQKPKRPYNGHKFLLTSREKQEIDLKLTAVVHELRSLQAIVLAILKGSIEQEPVPVEIPAALTEQPESA